MVKRIILTCLALLLAATPALAEVYVGTTVARNTLSIAAGANGVLEEMGIRPGYAVEAGETLARLRTKKVFANQNGTIARIHAQEGHKAEGTVLELAPVSRYTIHCTADEAYDSIASNLVHCGETLYLYCTKNGTHQGRGQVYAIDNETYMVEATAGEFYVGETVYLYRDEDYSYKQLVGIGTVVAGAAEAYESEEKIAAIHVREGEYVEKGELLYEILEGEDAEIEAPDHGIITACEAENGASVTEGQAIASLASYDDICVAIEADESQVELISVGDSAELSYILDAQERWVPGRVTEISAVAQDGCYTVYIAAEEAPRQLGLTVEVRID